MSKTKKILHWSPRVLTIALAAFISLFALDVFSEGYKWYEAIVALLIHLAPTYLIVGALLIAWKWEQIGGLIFIGLGLFYIIMTLSRPGFDAGWIVWLIISGPAFLVGGLFLANYFVKKK